MRWPGSLCGDLLCVTKEIGANHETATMTWESLLASCQGSAGRVVCSCAGESSSTSGFLEECCSRVDGQRLEQTGALQVSKPMYNVAKMAGRNDEKNSYACCQLWLAGGGAGRC